MHASILIAMSPSSTRRWRILTHLRRSQRSASANESGDASSTSNSCETWTTSSPSYRPSSCPSSCRASSPSSLTVRLVARRRRRLMICRGVGRIDATLLASTRDATIAPASASERKSVRPCRQVGRWPQTHVAALGVAPQQTRRGAATKDEAAPASSWSVQWSVHDSPLSDTARASNEQERTRPPDIPKALFMMSAALSK